MFLIWSEIAKGYLTENGWTGDKRVAKKFPTRNDCEIQINKLCFDYGHYKIVK